MYQRGGDRGWHRGHEQREVYPIPALRSPHVRLYGGGHPRHREHGNFGPDGYQDFHDYHDNPCHDRNYSEGQFIDCEDWSYNCEERPYQEFREPGYSRGGVHHDSGFHKGSYSRGGYKNQRGGEHGPYHNKQSEYRKKHRAKYSKVYNKQENPGKTKMSSSKLDPKGENNPGPSVLLLVSEDKSEINVSTKQKNTFEKTSTTNNDSIKSSEKNNVAPHDAKEEGTEDLKIESQNEVKTAVEPKEEILPKAETPSEVVVPMFTGVVKRRHSDDKNHSFTDDQREDEISAEKLVCVKRILETCNTEEAVHIPLLGGWTNISPPSPITPGDQGEADPDSGHDISETSLALRTAYIMAKKEEIELAFAQDCRTFAFVANTLLKKNPSIEAAVTSALQSSLHDLAGRFVHELDSFIDGYDKENSVLLNSSSKVQDTNT
ncbi:hypothetical protein GDO86_003373 [Hymenochirus boettgeri]|uniref:Periphilin-1 C-terminal domain-containing protein n=1 Tax=Hymenochirus boettgeri TaxID=247094 RepID=A0A8T2K0L6_9PIPI|nr:hypothetical protein GDO86_003373 [Hymenochirus boettgeri]KAG8451063.1 hypothetical protein GDO86_003373 [Hymenochirus boettgeri]KAG8451064.1 hypothetical protein GDO86_003373 [Hymenochirus boettgeri]KAG8451065.1 hypothetical protein GDO86_003373 [Hymenochirus boettgeri]